MRVLVASARIPFPPVDGAGLRTFHLLRALAQKHDVTLVAFDYGDVHEDPPIPIELIPVPWDWPDAYRAMRGDDPAEAERAYAGLDADAAEPWFVSCVASHAFGDALAEAVTDGIDVVVVEETSMGRFLDRLPVGLPLVLDLHNVHARMALREAGSDVERRREAARTLRFERALVRRSALVLAVSDLEAAAARELLGAEAVEVVSNGVDAASYADVSGETRSEVLFVGRMDYEPNVDAVRHFVAHVWPLVRAQAPEATFHVVGTDPAPEVRTLAAPDVVVHGRVEDVRAHYARAAVFVAPLRAGGGTRLKLLEAAASGRAIVTTSIGMEGLTLRPGREVVVAERPAAMAGAVVELLEDPARRKALGENARRVALAYDWAGIGASFTELLEDVARAGGRALVGGAG